jgi:hypothetical protein
MPVNSVTLLEQVGARILDEQHVELLTPKALPVEHRLADNISGTGGRL